ncbi:MAG: hypothetical protein EORIYHIE_002061 [Candidatus Fervidibacter sp.]
MLRLKLLDQLSHPIDQRLKTFSRQRGNWKNFIAKFLPIWEAALQIFVGCWEINLVGNHNLRLSCQLRAVEPKFLVDDLKIANRVSAFNSGNVNHVNQQRCPFGMTQKLMPQANPFVGALNKPRQVSHDKTEIVNPHRPQIRN